MSDRRMMKETTMKTTFLAAAAALLLLNGAAYAQPVGSDTHVIRRSDVTAPTTNGRTLETSKSIQAGGPQIEDSTLSQYGYDVVPGSFPERPVNLPSYEMRPDGSGLMTNGLLPAENWN
jgi:hypothetical protein